MALPRKVEAPRFSVVTRSDIYSGFSPGSCPLRRRKFPRPSFFYDNPGTSIPSPIVPDPHFGVLSFGQRERPTLPPAGVVTNVSLLANMSRSGVIGVTARMPIQDFNTLFAKCPPGESVIRENRLYKVFELGSRRTSYDSRTYDARH